MTQINPKLNIYRANPSFKADNVAMPFMPGFDYSNQANQTIPQGIQGESQIPSVELPDIYYSPNTGKKKSGFLDTLRKVDVMELIVPWFEHPLLMLGTCFGISKGVDAFSKSCNKEYEQSILGKAAKFGDKIENSGFVQSKPTQTGLKWLRTGWGKVKNTAMKSDVIKSMVETPSSPEFSMPKSELLSHQERTIEKFGEVLRDTGLLPIKEGQYGGKRLVDYHLDADAVQDLKNFFHVDKISKITNEQQAVSRYLLKKAGVAEAEISAIVNGAQPLDAARTKLLEIAGGADKLQSLLKGKTEAEVNEILNVCEKFKGIKTTKGTKIPFLTKQPLTNEAGFQDVYNRLHSIGKGAATKTGRFMSKFLQMVHRGFTFGGAKTGVLIWVAPHIMHTLINTYKADKSEKVGTFMNGMISAISWVFIFPLVLKGIHAYGGIQYAGMGKEKVAELKEKIAKFNKRVADGEFENFKAWKDARNALKSELNAMRHVENQGFITRCLRGISRFTKSDLLKLDRYKDKSVLKNILRNGPAKIKDFGWSAGRFAVFMFIGMPLVDKVINKCVSAVFGKSYDDTVEKENKEAKKKQKEFLQEDLQNRMYDAQAAKMGLIPQNSEAVQQKETAQNQPIEEQKAAEEAKQEQQNVVQEQPILERMKETTDVNKTQQQQQNIYKTDNYTYIPSQENILKTPVQKQMSKYIPSQLPGNVTKTFDNSGLEAALRRADRAEARALQTLAGKFPS